MRYKRFTTKALKEIKVLWYKRFTIKARKHEKRYKFGGIEYLPPKH